MPAFTLKTDSLDEPNLYETDPFYEELDERLGQRRRKDFTLPAQDPNEDMLEFSSKL